MRIAIVVEKFDGIEKGRANDGISTDADARGLADAEKRQLMDGLVGQSPAAADDTDIPLLVNAARHDSDLALAGRNDARAIGADQARFLEVDGRCYANHVEDRNAFGDANDQGKTRVGGFQNGVRGVRWGNEKDGRVRAGCFCGFGDGVEDGTLQVLCAALAGCNATNNVGSVLDHLLSVKSAFAPGESLDKQTCFLVYKDAHRAPPASLTTFWAPSFMSLAMVKFSALSRRICWPSSTLVPSMRTTTGTLSCRSLAAATTPVARTSQRKMPPKILMKTAFTAGSFIRMRKAFLTCSAEAPPPTSRKFAGEPPAYLMMSMVAMARPAPFTMQATLPSSLM